MRERRALQQYKISSTVSKTHLGMSVRHKRPRAGAYGGERTRGLGLQHLKRGVVHGSRCRIEQYTELWRRRAAMKCFASALGSLARNIHCIVILNIIRWA